MISNVNRIQIARDALTASSKLRKRFGFDLSSPINMYDLCEAAGVPVRFVEINMEGLYVHLGEGLKPSIFISALRPFHRKVFTCAHEYCHHYFGHGFSVDQISTSAIGYGKEELLVDTMASYLLMPPLGLKGAFAKRNLSFKDITPIDCFLIACSFEVGYSTLISQLLFNAHIDEVKAKGLLRQPLKTIKESIVGETLGTPLFFFDKYATNKTIDIETMGYIIFPNDVEVESTQNLEFYKATSRGNLYKAIRQGITRVYSNVTDWSCFIRIQEFQYVGLSKYRHLSD